MVPKLIRAPSRRLSACALGLGLILAAGPVQAQLDSSQQLCLKVLNDGLVRLADLQGGNNSQCLEDGRRGKMAALGADRTIEGCLEADVRFRVARAQQQLMEKVARKCRAPLPPFGATNAAIVGAAAVEQELALIHDIFGGNELDSSIVPVDPSSGRAPDSVVGRCQEKLAVHTQKCMEVRLREFKRCAKNGVRGGRTKTLYPNADEPFDDARDLERCIGWDQKAKFDKCRVKAAKKFKFNCSCVPLGTAFSGACFDALDLTACLDRLIACRSCLAINAAAGLSQDCDILDDTLINGSCPPVVRSCGDGIVQAGAGEECDDGGTQDGNGCDARCQQESSAVCTGEPSVCVLSCGNGVVEAGETCDDANLTEGDGCSDNCSAEAGYSCAGTPNTCQTICGDGLVRGTEACDDGNQNDGDGCDNSCEIEPGYTCKIEPAFLACGESPSDCEFSCGNGRLEGSELCDDENQVGGDGCTGLCEVEPGWECLGQPSSCNFTCGNGKVDTNESCDDGNTEPGDGCGAFCTVEPGFRCPGEPSVCEVHSCGNGIVDAGEGCDDANAVDGDCCSTVCEIEPAETVCRSAAGSCDLAESCDGVNPKCPPDLRVPGGVACRPAAGVCDLPETCMGTSPDCPPQVLMPSSSVCRPALGECDLAETCTGVDPGCPIDSVVPEGTTCEDGDSCTSPDECLAGLCVGASLCGDGVVQAGCGEECEVDGDCSDADDKCSSSCSCNFAPTIGAHSCVLRDPNTPDAFCVGGDNDGMSCISSDECASGGGFCDPVSGLVITTQLFPLSVALNGSLDIECGDVNPDTGTAPCECKIQEIDPVEVAGLGLLCLDQLRPDQACDPGEIDCGGGSALDTRVVTNHNIGACTGPFNCRSKCAIHCLTNGLGQPLDHGCEGFCDGGPSNSQTCSADTDCPDGSCSGSDGLPHGSICGCSCVEVGGGPSRPGGLQCAVGVSIALDSSLEGPCGPQCSGGANHLQGCAQATDCPGGACVDDTLVVIGRRCIPVTTELASGVIINAANTASKELTAEPGARFGVPFLCDALASSATTGMQLVGTVNFLDTTIGDLAVAARFSCQ